MAAQFETKDSFLEIVTLGLTSNSTIVIETIIVSKKIY